MWLWRDGDRPAEIPARVGLGLAILLLGLFLLAMCLDKPPAGVTETLPTTAQVEELHRQLDDLKRQSDELGRRLEEDLRLLQLRYQAEEQAATAGTDPELVAYAWERAAEAGLDPTLVLAVVSHESGWDATLVHSNSNGTVDYSLMQLNSGTWPWLAQQTGCTDPMDPRQNIRMGVWYLAYLLRRYGSEEAALTAYNRGEQGLQWHIASRGTARSAYSEAVINALPQAR